MRTNLDFVYLTTDFTEGTDGMNLGSYVPRHATESQEFDLQAEVPMIRDHGSSQSDSRSVESDRCDDQSGRHADAALLLHRT